MDREEIYNILKQARTQLDTNIMYNKKKVIITNLKKIGLNFDFNSWLETEIPLYIGPIHKFFKGRLLNLPTEKGEEIYIDEEFFNNKDNQEVIVHQLTHELLHSVCKIKKGSTTIYQIFGHDWCDLDKMLIGIDEATTQLFTDDFEEKRLNEIQDPTLYFIKNIMRIAKVIIGTDKLIMQYLNYNRDFENEFNRITNGKFNEFAYLIYQIYELSYKVNNEKSKELDTEQDERKLNELKDKLSENINILIRQEIEKKPELESLLSKEFENDDFNLTSKTTTPNEDLTQISSSKVAYQKFLAIREKLRVLYQSIRQRQLVKANLKNLESEDLKEGFKK